MINKKASFSNSSARRKQSRAKAFRKKVKEKSRRKRMVYDLDRPRGYGF